MNQPAFDELLRRLVAAEVDFVLVGGLALAAHGVVRGTQDVDIVAAPDPTNLKRIASVAVTTRGHIHTGDALLSSEPSMIAQLISGEHVAFETDLGRLDIVQGLKGVPEYERLREGAAQVEVLGVPVAVCSVADLRAMKRAAGRTRDLADLEDLDVALGDA